MSFAEANQTQENNVGFLFDKTKPEEILDLEPIDFFGPVPTEAFQGLDDWKTGGFDLPSNRALLTCPLLRPEGADPGSRDGSSGWRRFRQPRVGSFL